MNQLQTISSSILGLDSVELNNLVIVKIRWKDLLKHKNVTLYYGDATSPMKFKEDQKIVGFKIKDNDKFQDLTIKKT